MGIKIMIVVVALLFAVAAGADTSPRLDSMAANFLSQLSLPSGGNDYISMNDAYAAINEALEVVSTSFPAIERLDTLVTYDTLEGSALPSNFSSIQWCQQMIGDTARVALFYVPPDSFALVMPTVLDAQSDPSTDRQEARYYSTFAGRLHVRPKTMKDSTAFLIGYYVKDNYLDDAADTTLIPSGYRKYIKWWSLFLLEAERGDYIAATFWFTLFESARPMRQRVTEGRK